MADRCVHGRQMALNEFYAQCWNSHATAASMSSLHSASASAAFFASKPMPTSESMAVLPAAPALARFLGSVAVVSALEALATNGARTWVLLRPPAWRERGYAWERQQPAQLHHRQRAAHAGADAEHAAARAAGCRTACPATPPSSTASASPWPACPWRGDRQPAPAAQASRSAPSGRATAARWRPRTPSTNRTWQRSSVSVKRDAQPRRRAHFFSFSRRSCSIVALSVVPGGSRRPGNVSSQGKRHGKRRDQQATHRLR